MSEQVNDTEEPFLKIHSVYSVSVGSYENCCSVDAQVSKDKSSDEFNDVLGKEERNKSPLSASENKQNDNEHLKQNGHNPISSDSKTEVAKERKSRSLFSAFSDLTEIDTIDSSRIWDDSMCEQAENSENTMPQAAETVKSGVSGDSCCKGSEVQNGMGVSPEDDKFTEKPTVKRTDTSGPEDNKNVGDNGNSLASIAESETSLSVKDNGSDLVQIKNQENMSELSAKAKNVNSDIVACTAGLKNIFKSVSFDSVQQMPKEKCTLPEKTENGSMADSDKPEVIPTPATVKNEAGRLSLKSKKGKGRSLADVVKSLNGGDSFNTANDCDEDKCVLGEKQSDKSDHVFDFVSENDQTPKVDMVNNNDILLNQDPVATETSPDPDKQLESELDKTDDKDKATSVETVKNSDKDSNPDSDKTINEVDMPEDQDKVNSIEMIKDSDKDSNPASETSVYKTINEVFDSVLSADASFEVGEFDSPTKRSEYEALADPDDLGCGDEANKNDLNAENKSQHIGGAEVCKNLCLAESLIEKNCAPVEEKRVNLGGEEMKVTSQDGVPGLYDGTTDESIENSDLSDSSGSSIAPEDFEILQHAFSSYVALDDISVALCGAHRINIHVLPLDSNLRIRRPSTLDGLNLSDENRDCSHPDSASRKQDIQEWIEGSQVAENPNDFTSTSSSPLPPELEIEPTTTDSEPNMILSGISDCPPQIDLVHHKLYDHTYVKQKARKSFPSVSHQESVKQRRRRTVPNESSDEEFLKLTKGRRKQLSEEDRKRLNRIRVRNSRKKRKLSAAGNSDPLSSPDHCKNINNSNDELTVTAVPINAAVACSVKNEECSAGISQLKQSVDPTASCLVSEAFPLVDNARKIDGGERKELNLNGEELKAKNFETMKQHRQGQTLTKVENVGKSELAVLKSSAVPDQQTKPAGSDTSKAESSGRRMPNQDTRIKVIPKRKKLTEEEKRHRNMISARQWRRKQKLLKMQNKAESNDPGVKNTGNKRKFTSGAEAGDDVQRGDVKKPMVSKETSTLIEEKVGQSCNTLTSMESGIGMINGDESSTAKNIKIKKGKPASTRQKMKIIIVKARSRRKVNLESKGRSGDRNLKRLASSMAAAYKNSNRIVKRSKNDDENQLDKTGTSSDVFSFKSDSSVENVASDGNFGKFVKKIKVWKPSSLTTVVKSGDIRNVGVLKKKRKKCGTSFTKTAKYVRRRKLLMKEMKNNAHDLTEHSTLEPEVEANTTPPRNSKEIKKGRKRSSAVSKSAVASPAMSTPIPPVSRTRSKLKDTGSSNQGTPAATLGRMVSSVSDKSFEVSPICHSDNAYRKMENLEESKLTPFDVNSNIVGHAEDNKQSIQTNVVDEDSPGQLLLEPKPSRRRSRKDVPMPTSEIGQPSNLRKRGRPRKGSLDSSRKSLLSLNNSLHDGEVDKPSSLAGRNTVKTDTERTSSGDSSTRKPGIPAGKNLKRELTPDKDCSDETRELIKIEKNGETSSHDDMVDENQQWGKGDDLTVDTSFEEEPVQNYEISMNESDDFYLSMSVGSPPLSPVQRRASAPIRPKPRKQRRLSCTEKKSEVPVHVPAPPVLTSEDHAYKLKILMDKLKSQEEQLDKLRAQQK
jgi:hypothetical protein